MILLFPFAQKLRNGKENPKNYPHWAEVIQLLQQDNHQLIQLGVDSEPQLVEDFRKKLPITELSNLVNKCATWISVDSFGQHLGWSLGRRGVAIWGQSDPLIFGHAENVNLLKDRKYLREKQFWWWEQCEYRDDCWVQPEEVYQAVKTLVTR